MKVNVAVVGFGTIGAGVVQLVHAHAELLAERTGVEVVVSRIVDLDLERDRGVPLDGVTLSKRFEDVLTDPAVDIVLELVGGTGVAREIVRRALEAGKHVVTANKALLHAHGEELFELARRVERGLRFEASVAGGIPIIRVIGEALASDRIDALYGIVNGTTNFILTRMIEERWSFADALAKAQELGFAEADPTLDVNGSDAAHKLTILARLAFNAAVDREKVFRRGIDGLALIDVLHAKQLGYVVKLLAVAKLRDGAVTLRVAPTLVPARCALANVRNEYNAVMLRSFALGDSLFVGKGAGALPTATAVVSDVCDLARAMARKQEFSGNAFAAFNSYPTASHLEAVSRFYLRLTTAEAPGILARVTKALGDSGISISAIDQQEAHDDGRVPIVVLTHAAKESALAAALAEIEAMPFVFEPPVVLYVEDLPM
jgi:homoserine dehydrogenase